MDDADEREAFLKAIFDAPADDLPRLVFADWLDERGESNWAELIRIQCQRGVGEGFFPSEQVLADRAFPKVFVEEEVVFERGFRSALRIVLPAEVLSDSTAFRRTALSEQPHWYGSSELKIASGLIQSGKPIQTILNSAVTARIKKLDLSGSLTHFGGSSGESGEESTAIALLREYEYRPVVTAQAVEALVHAREARRLTHLDLRNNDLDNDAARAIVNSKNLIRLQSLHLFDGNQLRGRTWQQLLERFGPDVVQ